MEKEQCQTRCVGGKAGDYFLNGFHCAEAVAAAVLESTGQDARQAIAHATPFGGGMGKSFGETCGALTGGLIAIGHMHGRSVPGESWDIPASKAMELRERFLATHGGTCCGELRDRFGETQMVECAKIVKGVARDTLNLLNED